MSLQIGPGRPADNYYNPQELGEQPTVPKQNQNVVKERVFLTQNYTLRLIGLFSSFGLPPFSKSCKQCPEEDCFSHLSQ